MKMMYLRMTFLMIAFVCPKSNATIETQFFKPLPPDIQPDEYDLSIILNTLITVDYYYQGHVRIRFHCEQPTKKIVLNKYELKIDTKTVQVFALENGKMREIQVVDQREINKKVAYEYEIFVEEDLLKDRYYDVKMRFTKPPRKLSIDDKYNLFKYWCRNEKLPLGKFDGLGARELFPCFDQIDMKAKFRITIKHDHTLQGLSNSMLDTTKKNSESVNEKFKETESISTNSVAIAFLDVAYQHKELFIYFEELKISSKMYYKDSIADYFINMAHRLICSIIEYFLKLFSVPLKKLDIVINPKTMVTSYYGLIFIGGDEAFTLVDQSSSSVKYELFSKMCSAISQQWIGNMVSMSHWYENWLPEGFNHFLGVLCVNKYLPDSKNNSSQFEIINSFLDVLQAESEGKYNPIVLQHKPTFEHVVFDEKTKYKVYHLIRMMNFFLGSKVLLEGIKKFVECRKFKVSTVTDIWNAFKTVVKDNEAEASEPKILLGEFTVDEIMDTWTNQRGLPLISVTRNDDASVTVEQKPFPSPYTMKPDEPTNKCWIIPLSYTTQKEQKFENVVPQKWLTCSSSLTVTFPNLEEDEWVLFNLNMNGRVNYDRNNWWRIKESLWYEKDYSGIDTPTRTSLISDLFALAEVGEVSYDLVFDTMKYLPREKHYAIWKVAMSAFDQIWFFLRGTKLLEPFENYVGSILEPMFTKEGYEYVNISDLERKREETKDLFKQLILESSCRFNTDICRKISDLFIQKWKTNPATEWSEIIPINTNKVIHCQGVKNKSSSYREKLRSHYYKTSNNYDREIIMSALGCVQSSGSLKKYIKTHLNLSSIEKSAAALKSLISNKKGYQIMKKNFKSLLKSTRTYKIFDYTSLRMLLYTLLDVTNTKKDLDEVLTFAVDLAQSIQVDYTSIHFEKARRNIRWLQRYEEKLTLYLNKYKKKK